MQIGLTVRWSAGRVKLNVCIIKNRLQMHTKWLTRNHKQKILGSESLARWLVSLVLVLEIALEIERYRITASVSHLTCPLPPHKSVI